jgi:hypothetical protein
LGESGNLILQLYNLAVHNIHRLPQRRPALLSLLVLLPQLRNQKKKRESRQELRELVERRGWGKSVTFAQHGLGPPAEAAAARAGVSWEDSLSAASAAIPA